MKSYILKVISLVLIQSLLCINIIYGLAYNTNLGLLKTRQSFENKYNSNNIVDNNDVIIEIEEEEEVDEKKIKHSLSYNLLKYSIYTIFLFLLLKNIMPLDIQKESLPIIRQVLNLDNVAMNITDIYPACDDFSVLPEIFSPECWYEKEEFIGLEKRCNIYCINDWSKKDKESCDKDWGFCYYKYLENNSTTGNSTVCPKVEVCLWHSITEIKIIIRPSLNWTFNCSQLYDIDIVKIEQLIPLYPNNKTNDIRYLEIASGLRNFDRKKFKEANQIFANFIKDNSNDKFIPYAYVNRGFSFFNLRDFKKALNDFIVSVRLLQKDAETLNNSPYVDDIICYLNHIKKIVNKHSWNTFFEIFGIGAGSIILSGSCCFISLLSCLGIKKLRENRALNIEVQRILSQNNSHELAEIDSLDIRTVGFMTAIFFDNAANKRST